MKNLVVLFDFDGTLFETAPVDVAAVNRTRRHFGMPPFSYSEVVSLIGLPTTEFSRRCIGTGTQEAEFLKVFTREEIIAVKECGRLYPGIDFMLRDLAQRGATMAICSNGSKEYLEAACSELRIADCFRIIDYEHEGWNKATAAAQLLLRLGSDSGIMVGDRKLDIDAGRRNKMMTIGVTYGYGGDEPYAADISVSSGQELHEKLLKLLLYS